MLYKKNLPLLFLNLPLLPYNLLLSLIMIGFVSSGGAAVIVHHKQVSDVRRTSCDGR